MSIKSVQIVVEKLVQFFSIKNNCKKSFINNYLTIISQCRDAVGSFIFPYVFPPSGCVKLAKKRIILSMFALQDVTFQRILWMLLDMY
jgi:hypothetical protein